LKVQSRHIWKFDDCEGRVTQEVARSLVYDIIAPKPCHFQIKRVTWTAQISYIVAYQRLIYAMSQPITGGLQGFQL
jgi:hypothetical protein